MSIYLERFTRCLSNISKSISKVDFVFYVFMRNIYVQTFLLYEGSVCLEPNANWYGRAHRKLICLITYFTLDSRLSSIPTTTRSLELVVHFNNKSNKYHMSLRQLATGWSALYCLNRNINIRNLLTKVILWLNVKYLFIYGSMHLLMREADGVTMSQKLRFSSYSVAIHHR